MFLPVVLCGSVRASAEAFSPTQLSGYVNSPYNIALLRSQGKLWQDTAMTVPAVADGDPVRRIDCNGTYYDAPSDAARPLLYSEGGGKWSLSFDGIDDRIRLFTTLNQPYTRGCVWRHSSPQDNSTLMLDGGTSDRAYLNFISANTVRMFAGAAGPSATATNNTWNYTVEVFSGASSKLYLNAASATTGNAGSGNPDGVTLGASQTGSYACVCRISALCLVTGEVSGSDLASLRAYLAALTP